MRFWPHNREYRSGKGSIASVFLPAICHPVDPEVVGSGGHPACRTGRASCRPEQRLKRGSCVLVRTRDPPGRMPRLYGRRDARRYDVPNLGRRRLPSCHSAMKNASWKICCVRTVLSAFGYSLRTVGFSHQKTPRPFVSSQVITSRSPSPSRSINCTKSCLMPSDPLIS